MAVAAAAVVDGIRRDDDPAPAATTEEEPHAGAAAALRQLGARGELILSGERCGEERFTLPSLTRDRSDECGQPAVESPDGEAKARCFEDNVELTLPATREPQRLPGCAPAWRPDGTITAAYGDEVVTYRPCRAERRCAETLIARAELERAALRHPTVPDRPARLRALVDGIAWLSDTRAAVSISIRLGGRFEGLGPLGAIAFFDDGRLERTPQYFRLTGGRLASSPRGSYVTQTPDVILRPDGSQLSLPQHLRNARDFAWSPDERLLALATPFAVEVVDVASLERYDRTGSGLRSVTLPQSAARLAWR
ncbi:MAG TPA: hypothetical protein VEW11_00200 [Gaiellaceae bacterium]|nr:hypothetical protein [Gaiellaceae bacterium]